LSLHNEFEDLIICNITLIFKQIISGSNNVQKEVQETNYWKLFRLIAIFHRLVFHEHLKIRLTKIMNEYRILGNYYQQSNNRSAGTKRKNRSRRTCGAALRSSHLARRLTVVINNNEPNSNWRRTRRSNERSLRLSTSGGACVPVAQRRTL